MDETKMRWYRWIADHAQYVFWGVWGAGVGAFGAVLLKAVDVGADALRIYMAVLTVMMGGALGLVTSRGMDMLADRRALRRKIYFALALIRSLIYHLERIDLALKTIRAVPNRAIDIAGTSLRPEEVAEIIVLVRKVHDAAETRPDLVDMVESELDVTIERLCRGNFRFCRRVFKVPDELDDAGSYVLASRFIRTANLAEENSAIDGLKTVAANLETRISSLA
jgi:hypothetical protein